MSALIDNSIEGWQELGRRNPQAWVAIFERAQARLIPSYRRALIAASPSTDERLAAMQRPFDDEEPPPLAGAPHCLQDPFDVRGLPTACGAPQPLQTLFAEPAESNGRLARLTAGLPTRSTESTVRTEAEASAATVKPSVPPADETSDTTNDDTTGA
jgi:Asp-tRNA(Asn)/Glu-tRNA(Gln) amidotransferase A subunit family amidase